MDLVRARAVEADFAAVRGWEDERPVRQAALLRGFLGILGVRFCRVQRGPRRAGRGGGFGGGCLARPERRT